MAKQPTTAEDFLQLVVRSQLCDESALQQAAGRYRQQGIFPREPVALARQLIRDQYLTYFQADQLLRGKHKGFVIGKYRVLEHLGSGGMGTVFLSMHTLMQRMVALKLLPTAGQSQDTIQRFYREARAIAAIDHPNIVHAHDIDHVGELHFLVMEYVDGLSLEELVKAVGALDYPEVAHYVAQAAIGLHYIHAAGLIHRDIKPSNLLIETSTGTIKILDLGLARFHLDPEKLTGQLDLNAVLGTADYLSPEQASDAATVSESADLYCLGGTMYYLLTGRPPFDGASAAQKLMKHQVAPVRSPRDFRPDIPEDLHDLVVQLLGKRPDQRPASAAEVVNRLARWLETPIELPPVRKKSPLSPQVRRLLGAETGSAERPAISPSSRSSSPDRPPERSSVPSRVSGRSSVPSRTPERRMEAAAVATPSMVDFEIAPDASTYPSPLTFPSLPEMAPSRPSTPSPAPPPVSVEPLRSGEMTLPAVPYADPPKVVSLLGQDGIMGVLSRLGMAVVIGLALAMVIVLLR